MDTKDRCFFMRTPNELLSILKRIEGRPYPAYKDTKGQYDFNSYILSIDHVQSDPFASPSDVSIRIPEPGFPRAWYDEPYRRIALQDGLLRLVGQAIAKAGSQKAGSGKSGNIHVSRPGQEILERTALRVDPETGSLTIRFHVGFPAAGRRILARELETILFKTLPAIIESSLFYDRLSGSQKDFLKDQVELATDQHVIRQELEKRHLSAFVANDAILPRTSGNRQTPMENALPFKSPESLEIELDLPYAGKIKGMGLPEGVVLIVGGGYHGKSTLLEALELGIYNHIRHDGREYVISRDDAVKIRAEDGRCVHAEDISRFIQNLPQGRSTTNFSSEDASGSTSQAANVTEAIDSGSKLLLLDEDTSATNFMVRDELMASVVHADQEPIIPFVCRIQDLAKKEGVSTILVAGSSGAYFDKADVILQMDNYEPKDITEFAKKKAADFALPEQNDYPNWKPETKRIPQINKDLKADRVKVKTSGLDTVSINREPVDVRYMEQLVDQEQLSALGRIALWASREIVDGKKSFDEVLDAVQTKLDQDGLSAFGKGEMAQVRPQEIAGLFNRWRSQQFKQEHL